MRLARRGWEPAIFYGKRRAIRWSNAKPRPSRRWKALFPRNIGRHRRRFIFRAAKVPAPGTLIPQSNACPGPMSGCLKEAEKRRWRSPAPDRAGRRQSWSRGLRGGSDRCLLPQCGSGWIPLACRTAGLLTGEDIASVGRRIPRRRVTYDYGRFTVCKAGFWSQGPVAVATAGFVEGGSTSNGLDPAGARFHPSAGSECAKLRLRGPRQLLWRSAFVAVPRRSAAVRCLQRRTSPAGRNQREVWSCAQETSRGLRRQGSRWASDRNFGPQGRASRPWGRWAAGRTNGGEARRKRAGGHRPFSTSSTAGENMISSHALRWLAASRRRFIPALGFLPLARGRRCFWLDESHPAGVGPGQAARAPRCRRPSAMRDGEPYPRLGARQAETSRINGPASFLLRHAHAGHNLQQAIDAPAWHSEHFPEFVLAADGASRRAGGPRAA